MTRQQRRAAERAAKKKNHHSMLAEVVIYDDDCESLADLFLPPVGTTIDAAALKAACARLIEATRALKRLNEGGRES